MTRGCYLKISDELECKLLNNCPPINISTIVHIAGKEQTRKSVHFEFDLNLIQLLKNKCMYTPLQISTPKLMEYIQKSHILNIFQGVHFKKYQ